MINIVLQGFNIKNFMDTFFDGSKQRLVICHIFDMIWHISDYSLAEFATKIVLMAKSLRIV